MKILCISDTHGLHNRVPEEWMVEADVLIHAGDCTNRGYLEEAKQFLNWFEQFDHEHKIFIAGNHDWVFEQHPQKMLDLMKNYPSINYLLDEELVLDGIKFYGSPQTPYFFDWAFNCARDLQESKAYNKPLIGDYWDEIPLDTDVLITHGPPYGIGDFVPYKGGEYVGCKALLDTVSTKLTKLKAHIFGHIHYSYGSVNKQNIQFINASCCNERYEPIQKPILIEI